MIVLWIIIVPFSVTLVSVSISVTVRGNATIRSALSRSFMPTSYARVRRSASLLAHLAPSSAAVFKTAARQAASISRSNARALLAQFHRADHLFISGILLAHF